MLNSSMPTDQAEQLIEAARQLGFEQGRAAAIDEYAARANQPAPEPEPEQKPELSPVERFAAIKNAPDPMAAIAARLQAEGGSNA